MTEGSVQDVITEAAGRVDGGDRAVFERFAKRLLEGVESHPTGGAGALAALAVEAFEWISVRRPGEILVRVHNRSDRPGHTILEVLQEDHPFILDTLELLLTRFGAQERLVIHPIVQIERDEAGQLLDVRAEANGSASESYVYIEFVPPTDDPSRINEMTGAAHQVMSWVADVTEDHRRMIRSVRELNANLEFAGPALEGGLTRAERVQRFLDWIIDGRFVFVGMRRYRVHAEGDDLEVQIVPGTGLGMWRDDASSRLQHALRGAEVPLEILEDLEDPRIILISKSHMESRIHRAGRLDRVFV